MNKETKQYIIIELSTCVIIHISEIDLIDSIKDGEVINLELGKKDKIVVKWVIEQAPNGFKEEIDRKYNELQKSSKLLGLNRKFAYVIVGKYVILTHYNGEDFTVPSFVTSIGGGSLGENISKITIQDGVHISV